MKELDNLQKALCPDGEATPPIPCKVFPTRQKALAEYVAKQKQAAAAKEAAREAQTASSSGPAMTAGQVNLGFRGREQVSAANRKARDAQTASSLGTDMSSNQVGRVGSAAPFDRQRVG